MSTERKSSKKEKTRILVFGTFDFLHKGHLNFFKQARKLSKNSFLIVSIARDANVKKIKGSKPVHSEKQRVRTVRQVPLVDKVVLGSKSNYINHILKEKPEIIALGYDQSAYTQNLKDLLAKSGLKVTIFRLKSFYPKKYKSSLVRGNML